MRNFVKSKSNFLCLNKTGDVSFSHSETCEKQPEEDTVAATFHVLFLFASFLFENLLL